MIQELSREEMILTNGGIKKEVTPESIGYEVGRLVGKGLMIWATFFK